jgi:putative peptidoglycan lipid II flippase
VSAGTLPPDESAPIEVAEGGQSPEQPVSPAVRRSGAAAVLVAAGIFMTRIFGLIRTRAMASYLGASDASDVLTAAFRIPNLLQNLFGEGVLSASFIPVYARLLARGEHEEARRVAGAVAGLLAAVTTTLVAIGVLTTPWFIGLIAPGFTGEKRELTITLVRILFPGTGLLVLSAWCLGILNSHRRFLLSYTAPVAWNLSIIAALVWGARDGATPYALVETVAWWSVAGSAAQFLVQLPLVLRLARGPRPSLRTTSANVRDVVRNFAPAFVGRGAVQISAYVDMSIVSLLGVGATAALGYAQQLYLLPVALFGMSVSAAELPSMSGDVGHADAVAAKLRDRLGAGLRRIAFFVVPSAAAFLALGDVAAATVYQHGAFTREESVFVWAALAGSSVGMLATTLARLYSSAFYARGDTRTPLRFALVRIALAAVLAWLLAVHLPRLLGIEQRWGIAGITVAGGVAGWVELALLRRALGAQIGRTGVPVRYLGTVWAAAAVGALAAWGAKLALPPLRPEIFGIVVLGTFGLTYLAVTSALGVPEALDMARRVRRLVGRGRR